ncbi:hypothetical protein OS31_40860 [Dickeya oryzae]
MINITKDMFVEVMSDALQGKRENLEMRLRILIRKLKKRLSRTCVRVKRYVIA